MKINLFQTVQFFSIFIFLNVHSGFGQTTVSGIIVNQSDSTLQRGINVTIQKYRDTGILGFAISKGDGSFSISFDSELDSIWLVAKSMNIEKIELQILNLSQYVKLEAKREDLLLNEHLVEGAKGPITMKKDTLSFEVENFSNQDDRFLLDVLKRLPGLEVYSNGAISYRGEPIQKFYIEGLDLLEGRYNIATRNMPVEAIKSVEVLENHQPIRMMDSIEFSSKSSINIRLKKKEVVLGRGYVGGGVPGIWDTKIAPMIFNKNFQSILSFGSNNAGINLSDEILDLGYNSNQSNKDRSKEWFRSSGSSQPGMEDNRYIFNRSFLGSLNTLKKLSNELEIKTSIDYSKEDIQNSFLINRSYFLEEGTFQIVESGVINERSDQIRFKFNLIKNSYSDYFENSFQASFVNTSFITDFTFVDQKINQQISQPDLYLSNNFRKLIKLGTKVLDLNSDLSFLYQRPKLITLPPFIAFDSLPAINNSTQNIRFSNFAFNNFVAYKNLRLFDFSVSGTSGVLVKNSYLQSSSFLENFQIGFPFENNIRLKELSGYSSLSLERNTKKSNVKLTIPIRYATFQMVDFFNEASIGSPSMLIFEPELYWGLDSGPYFNFKNSIRRNVEVGDLNEIFPGQIFVNFQTSQVMNSHIPIVEDNRLVLRQSFKDPLISLFINSTVSFSYSNRNTLMENQVKENGQVLLSAINKDNVGKGFYWNADVSKFVPGIKSTLAAGSNVNLVEREIVVNDVFQFLLFNRFNGYLKAAFRPAGIINFELKYDYTSVQSSSENAFDNQSFINSPSFTFILLPAKNQSGKLSFESLTIDSNAGKSKSRINFLDFSYNFQIPKSRIELSLISNNLLGQNLWSTIHNSSFILVEEFRLLRPRQVTFRLAYSL